MKSLRSLTGLLTALALAVLATSAAADNKIYSFKANGGNPIPAGSSGKFVITFTNLADGNSTFNSVQVGGSNGTNTSAFKFTAAKVTSGGKPGNISGLQTATLKVTDLSPVKSTQQGGSPLTIEVEVSTSVSSCSGGSITWTPDAWTGSGSTGTNFFTRPVVDPTTVTSTCSLLFVTNPAKARTDQNISSIDYNPTYNASATPPVLPVRAKLMVNGSPVGGKAIDVKLNAACGATLVGTTSASTGSDGVAEFGGLKSSTAGTGCVLKAEYRDDARVSDTSSSFSVVNASAVISPTITSVSTSSETTLTVKLLNGTGVIPQSGTGTISVVSGAGNCTLGSPTTISSTTGELAFTGILGVNTGTTCKLQVEGNFGGTPYTVATANLTVFDGTLACGDESAIINPSSSLGNQINGSPGINFIGDIEYYKGARGVLDTTDPTKPKDCVPVNATYVNNIGETTDDTTSVNGKTIPANGAALYWDEVLQPNSTFRVVTTFKDEWTDGNGWLARRTRLCLNDGCTDRAYLKVCQGTALVAASMPVYVAADVPGGTSGLYAGLIGKKMPACIYGEAYTAVVPVEAKGCTASSKPSGSNAACIRNTTELLIVGDPAWDR
jgi:hypothetical protein